MPGNVLLRMFPLWSQKGEKDQHKWKWSVLCVILLTPLSNCQGTRSRRKEEEETKGVVLLWAESSLSSLKWRDGSQSSVLLKHANAMKLWNQNQNTAFPAEKKKEKDFKSLFIQLWKIPVWTTGLRVSIPLGLTLTVTPWEKVLP